VVMKIYGYKRFADDFHCMVGFHPNVYWRLTWTFITPATLLFIIIFNAWQHVPCYLEDYVLPDWAQGLGWAMVAFALFWLPFWAIIVAYQKTRFRGLCDCPYDWWTMRRLLAASTEWQPALEEHQVVRENQNNKNLQIDGMDAPPAYLNGISGLPTVSSGSAQYSPAGYDNPGLSVDSKDITSL